MQEDMWFTPEEVAAKLKIGETKVYTYLRSGQIKGLKLGRHWRIPASELDPESLLRRQAIQTAQKQAGVGQR